MLQAEVESNSSLIGTFEIFLIVVTVLAIIFVWKGVLTVSEGRVVLVERFGRFHRALNPGINFILPGLDKKKRVEQLYTMHKNGVKKSLLSAGKLEISTKEQLLDPPKTNVIASDNAVLHVDSILAFKIIDAELAVYAVDNLGESLKSILETTLRQEVGKLNSDSVIISREQLGLKLQEELEYAADPWGIRIIRVEIESIDFDDNITEKLSKAREKELEGRADVAEAEREKEAKILRAEGLKAQEILIAEGNKARDILTAEGNKARNILEAEGRYESDLLKAKGITAINESMSSNAEGFLSLETLRAQTDIATAIGQSENTLIVPQETIALIGAVKSIAHLAKNTQSKPLDG
jgi:regulator of protease activity HflC (stomatin/prohibitin superfamily)